MNNQSKIARFLGSAMLAAAFLAAVGGATEANAQRDPFEKPAWARQRDPQTLRPGKGPTGPTGPPVNLGVPAIEQRIDYYKRLREDAVANGVAVPKVTSVLTLSELSVTGIFKTPRGYAAMVEATPIRLSYTIYPGEKFFDGQLVAVEEHRLVFRKVTKMSNGKFVASVENMPLRTYKDRDIVQGTAPAGAASESAAKASSEANAGAQGDKKVAAAPIVSPMSEMEMSAAKPTPDDAAKKTPKKAVKVAKKNK